MINEDTVYKKTTRMEWSLLFGLIMQASALIWGASKLSASVENLNRNMESMSDYAVLRYRVEQSEQSLLRAHMQIAQLERGKK